MISKFNIFIVFLCLALVQSAKIQPCKWPLYKQCDKRWANDPLGTSQLTICQAGCAMSDVSMSLAAFGETIDGKTSDPGTLNSWLIKNGGYVDTNLIVWNSIHVLGKMKLISDKASLTIDTIQGYISECRPVIANVMGGQHWVLLIGYDTLNSTKFYVNDPGFNREFYMYDGMLDFITYTNSSGIGGQDIDLSFLFQKTSCSH